MMTSLKDRSVGGRQTEGSNCSLDSRYDELQSLGIGGICVMSIDAL